MELIFNEIDDYGQITSLMSYNERLKLIPDLKATKLLRTAQNEDIDLILMDDTYIKVFEMAPFPLGVMVAGYVLSYKSDELMVWERCGLQKTFPLPLKLTTVYKAGLSVFTAHSTESYRRINHSASVKLPHLSVALIFSVLRPCSSLSSTS